MNLKFHYLYRDGANYKQNHFEVFSNNQYLLIEKIDESIRLALIEGGWFYAQKWNLKDLHLYKWDEEIDHNWHEYDFVENTQDPITLGDIADFIRLIETT